MGLSAGTRLGSYEVVSSLGAGGMGEVYRARDSKLGREVALKILPDVFAHDPDRLARFEREARLLASLNHPHIAAIYGLEESGSVRALVLELVEGETLAERIVGSRHRTGGSEDPPLRPGSRGGLPLDEVLPIARQIAEALEAAHEQGIVHRDLKPANIKITPGGVVKVLDFGLAKLHDPAKAGHYDRLGNPTDSSAQPDLTASPTLTSPAMMTGAGVILGTAAYMSPEQAKGREADKRSDAWAFGCVLYEMLAGRRPFEGEDVSDTMAAVLMREPDWSALPETTPPSVERLLRRCLRRDPRQRLRDLGDARLDLDDVTTDVTKASQPRDTALQVGSASRWTRALPWALAAAMTIVSLALLTGQLRDTAPAGSVIRAEINLPPGVELFTTGGRSISIAPDGSRVAFIGVAGGVRQIYVRDINGFESVPLRGTETVSTCFFSFDGESVVFITADSTLKKVSLADGLVTTVVKGVAFVGGASGPEGIVFGREGALWTMPPSGTPVRLTTLDAATREVRHAWPTVLPGGEGVLFASLTTGGTWQIESVVRSTGQRRVVVAKGTFPLYAPGGYLVFSRDGELLAAPFDVASLGMTGSPVRVIQSVPEGSAGVPLVDVSAAGTLIYAPSTAAGQIVWVTRQGAEQRVTETARLYANPRLVPDGTRVLVSAGSAGDLWIHDLKRTTFTRIASAGVSAGNVVDAFPVITPDGGRVIFRGRNELRWLALDGSGRGDVIAGTTGIDYPGSVSPDGRQLAFVRLTPENSGDVFVAPLEGRGKIQPVLATPVYEGSARFSPDGRWMVYTSNDTGQMEIYLRPFPAPDRKWQVSTEGGTQPVWNPNGREIFYRSGSKMLAVEVSFGSDVTLSPPRVLFDQPYAFGAGITIPSYDVSRDGERFLMIKEESRAGRLNLIVNWFEELRRTGTD